MRSCNRWSHEKGYRRISNLDSFMTKALNEFRSLEIFDETARVNLMHENKIKIPLTPVGEILPRGNYFNENEDHLKRLLLSYMKKILFLQINFFLNFIAHLPHTVIKTVIWNGECWYQFFVILLLARFLVSKVISHSKVGVTRNSFKVSTLNELR